ncbi:MAG TPA: hypothetical protein VFX20_18075 [Steroidobacteraceae bacterium]|nr:hypothetical protein [Steroidobacteraceae bacterium]
MNPECEVRVARYLGRDLKPKESKEVEDAVSLQMRLLARKDPQSWAAMPAGERLDAGAKAAAQAIIGDLKLKQQRLSLQIAAHDRIEAKLGDTFQRLPTDAKPGARLRAVSQLLAFDASGHGIASAETWGTAIANEAFGRLLPLWNSVKGFAHLFEDQKGISDLVHELYGEDSANPAAREGARVWKQATDELRNRANAAGMDIGELDDWHLPQSNSQTRIAQAGLEKWSADTLPLLDRSKYLHVDGTRLTDDEMRDVLSRAYDSLITDGANKQEAGIPRGFGSIAKRGSGHRVLFYKGADSYLTYQGLYGEKSLWPTLTGHIRSMARDIGLTETLGPNAAQTFKFFNDRTYTDELRQTPAAKTKLDHDRKFNEALFDYVSGNRGIVNAKIAAVGQAWRNFETAAKLGRVVITALGDEAGMSATAFANKVPWSETFLREFKYLNPANAGDRDIAAQAGLGINRLIGGLNRFGQEDLQLQGGEGRAAAVRNFMSKLAGGVLNASGAEAMWDARRRALGSMLMSYLGKTTRTVERFADINAQDHGMLASKGITERDWQIWRRAEVEDWGLKHGVLTPQSIWSIPDEKLDEAIAPDLNQVRSQASGKLGELQAKDAQEQQWISTRAQKLDAWLKSSQARIATRIGKSDAAGKAALEKIGAGISRMQEQLEYASSYWKSPPDENTPGISGKETVGFYGKGKLRSLGVDEGRALEAIRSLSANGRAIARDMQRFKKGQLDQFAEDFAARQQELEEFTNRVQGRSALRAQIADRIQGEIEPQLAQARLAARRHAATMLLGHILEETGMGVMDTGARQRASMLFGTTPGTFAGELTRSAFLFKSFSFSMMMKHWQRAAAMPTRGATASYVARLIVTGTIMGAVANQLRALTTGVDPPNMDSPKFWGSAFLRGGGLGFYGDFLYAEATSHDTTLLPALLGPLATEIETLDQLTANAAFKAARGERTDEGAHLVRWARGNIPFLNMWYTQAAMDHLVWNEMQDATSPGYLDRMQAKAFAQRGTTYWWEPGQVTPSRGPDFAKAWQPDLGSQEMDRIRQAVAQNSEE